MGLLWAVRSLHLALLKLGAAHQRAQQHRNQRHAAFLPAAGRAANASQVWFLLLHVCVPQASGAIPSKPPQECVASPLWRFSWPCQLVSHPRKE